MKKIIITASILTASSSIAQNWKPNTKALPFKYISNTDASFPSGEFSPLLPPLAIWSGQAISAYLSPENLKENHILLAACSSHQEAQEKRFLGKTRGAFSYYLERCMKRVDWKITYREAHEGTLTRLRDNGFIQIPQLEAPESWKDKQFFGSFSDYADSVMRQEF